MLFRSKLGIQFADGVIMAEENINSEISEFAKNMDLPILEYKNEDDYIDACSEFYDEILTQEGVLVE